MFRGILFNRHEEIVFYRDYKSFEEAVKELNIEIDAHRDRNLASANIYKFLNPEVNQSMQMIASLRTMR